MHRAKAAPDPGWLGAPLQRLWVYRGQRVGEASHPGPDGDMEIEGAPKLQVSRQRRGGARARCQCCNVAFEPDELRLASARAKRHPRWHHAMCVQDALGEESTVV
eukprot:9561929-Prorocentrum_lima.AAC.1